MLTAADIMTKDVICAKLTHTAATVARQLSDHHISAVPVCDASGAVVGMVSEADLIAPSGGNAITKRARWLDILAAGNDVAISFLDCIKMENRSVVDVMVRSVITASPETEIPGLADLLIKHHIKRLPIVKDGKLVGIVSRADLIRSIAQAPSPAVDPL